MMQKFFKAFLEQNIYLSFSKCKSWAKWKYLFIKNVTLIDDADNKKFISGLIIFYYVALNFYTKLIIWKRDINPPPLKSVHGLLLWNPTIFHYYLL